MPIGCCGILFFDHIEYPENGQGDVIGWKEDDRGAVLATRGRQRPEDDQVALAEDSKLNEESKMQQKKRLATKQARKNKPTCI
jgi:hypothetical protein